MNRLVTALLGLSLGIAAFAGPAGGQEQTSPATVVELAQPRHDRGGPGQDGREVARGDAGESISYTIVETPDPAAGDATTAVAPAAPDLSRVPVQPDSGETTLAPPTGEPASAPVASNPDAGVAGDATVTDPGGESPELAATCADFGSWYDAQVHYESLGSTAAAPELVSALDPDVDGVACEELIVYS
ncbi:MAG: excalibur calcium-binding domain-containing protein [Chloroflexota bacterium]|nr:excalibur calcium-binding domain-containing protein [Chloroflexota bacterium]